MAKSFEVDYSELYWENIFADSLPCADDNTMFHVYEILIHEIETRLNVEWDFYNGCLIYDENEYQSEHELLDAFKYVSDDIWESKIIPYVDSLG